MGDESRTLWCGNLSDRVTEELLYELFLQAAPLERVRIPTDKEGRKSDFGFITLKHEVSVNYVVQLLNGTWLYDKKIRLRPRNTGQNQQNQNHQQQSAFEHQNVNVNQLILMGQMMHLAYNQQNFINHNRRPPFNNDRGNRNENSPYKHYNNRHDGYNGGRQDRNMRNNHRNHDRGRRSRFY